MPQTLVRSLRRPPITIGSRLRSAWRSFTLGPYSLKDPALTKLYERLFGEGAGSAAGIHVTPENAFTFSAVFSAVLQISSDVAKLPLNLMKRRPNGRGADYYTDSPLYYLLKKEPNPESTSMVFRRTLIAHALTCHGGYAEIERDAANRPIALWILTPDRVEPIRQITTVNGRLRPGPLVYRIDGRDDTIIPAQDMIHIHGLGYDGYVGYEVINKARQAIGLALAAERFGAQYFGRGTVLGGWLEVDQDLDEDQKSEIVRTLEAFKAKQDSAFRVLVTGLGHKYHQFDVKAKDSQLDELRIRQIEDAARFFRMPPHRLGVNTPGTVSYASVEAADLNYYKGPILDWITLIEQEFDRKLIPRLERKIQFVKHNANAFLRGTMKERQEALGVMRDKGVINANEWRDLEDMNPQDGDQGDLYLVQSAQVPLSKLDALVDAQITKAQTPPAPPAAPSSQADPETDAVVAELQTRLARAEALLAEATTRSGELQTQIAAATASEGAKSEAVTTLDTALRAQQTLAAETLALVTGLRTELAAAQQATAEWEAIADGQTHAAEAARAEAVRGILEARAERDRLASEAESAGAALAEAEARLAALEADRSTIGTELEAARDAAEQALAAAAEAETARADAQRALDERALELEHVTDSWNTAEQQAKELAETRDALQAQIETLEATKLASEAELTQLRAALAALQQQAAEAQADAEGQREAVAEQTERRAAVEAELVAQRQAQRDRLTGVIGAHRGLIVDALGRMTRREAQQARSKQATPEKLRRWLQTFPDLHAAICVEALLPAMRVHVAWRTGGQKCGECGHPSHAGSKCGWEVAMGSDCPCDLTDRQMDATVLTERLVREHIAAFVAQIQCALDADPEEFHAVLDRTLARWESERAATVADAFLAEEIRHVQRG